MKILSPEIASCSRFPKRVKEQEASRAGEIAAVQIASFPQAVLSLETVRQAFEQSRRAFEPSRVLHLAVAIATWCHADKKSGKRITSEMKATIDVEFEAGDLHRSLLWDALDKVPFKAGN